MICAGNGLKIDTGESRLKKPLIETERVYGKQFHNAATAAASSSSATYCDNFSRCGDRPVDATNAMSMIESFNVDPGYMMPSGISMKKKTIIFKVNLFNKLYLLTQQLLKKFSSSSS